MPLPIVQSSCLNPMSFTENQHGNVVLERLRHQRDSGRFCDVVLVVQGKQFPAHRNILAACSPYFDSILKVHKVVKEQVTVNCLNADTFELLLNYMYSGSVVIDRNNVMELLKLSNNFLVTKLKNYCAEYLDRYLDPANCLTVKDLALKYNMPGLVKNTCLFLEAKINRVLMESTDVLDYHLTKVERLLSEANYDISPPVQLQFVLRWVGANVAEREGSFKQLLAFVSVSVLERQFLTQVLDTDSVCQRSETCRFALLQAMYESSIPLQHYEAQYQKLLAKHSGEVNIYFNTPNEGDRPTTANGTDEGSPRQKTPASPVAEDEPVPVPVTVNIKQEIPDPLPDSPDASNGPSLDSRPPLRLTLKLPFMTRKAKLLGKHKLYKKHHIGLGTQFLGGKRPRVVKLRANAEDGALESGGENGVADGKAEVLFKCPHCVYTSNCQSRIQSHIEKAHSRNRTFVCNLCPFQCRWNREYYMHMKQHFQGPPFKCETCDYTAERIQMLLTHRMKHTDERPYKCTECEYRCRTKTNLVAHMRSHTGEKPFSCPECARGFAIKSTLDQHLATHSDIRPFRCEQCSFSTKYQSHLISHKRIHTGDVFHCQFADCSYSSPKKSQLAAHLRTHLAVRAHACKVCGRSFIEKSHLVRHERIHLAEKPFKCEHCEYASSRRDKLKEHIQKHHSTQSGGRGPYKRRYRRAKQPTGGGLLDRAGFRPISPELRTNSAEALAPSPVLARPSSAIFPSAAHTMQPSPALSLNLSFDSLAFPSAAVNKDVLLSTQLAPTPTPASTSSPHSTTNSLQSEPFLSSQTPTADLLQRPASLPSLGGASSWPHFPDFSFTAMF